jgi:hypothetical protein
MTNKSSLSAEEIKTGTLKLNYTDGVTKDVKAELVRTETKYFFQCYDIHGNKWDELISFNNLDLFTPDARQFNETEKPDVDTITMEKTIQITLTELKEKFFKECTAEHGSGYAFTKSPNSIFEWFVSHLKEVEDVTSEGNTNQASVEQNRQDASNYIKTYNKKKIQ